MERIDNRPDNTYFSTAAYLYVLKCANALLYNNATDVKLRGSICKDSNATDVKLDMLHPGICLTNVMPKHL